MSGTTCHYCGLQHERVEAGGVYYCPNRLCTGPGAWSHRKDLPSYKEDDQGYTIDAIEVLKHVHANPQPDLRIWAAECAKVNAWLKNAGLADGWHNWTGWLPKCSTTS